MHYQISLNYTDPPQSVSSSQNPRVDLPFVCKAKPSHMGVGLKGVEPAKRGLVVQLLVELLLPHLNKTENPSKDALQKAELKK